MSATFTVTIATDNAAFTDEETDAPAPAREVARILRELANRLEAYGVGGPEYLDNTGPLTDAYGNVVGRWEYQP